MKNALLIGIDPGNNGAIAILDGESLKLIKLVDMPTVPSGHGKKMKVNAAELRNILNVEDAHVIIEDVRFYPTDGKSSIASLQRAFGIAEGVAAALFLPYTLVSPERWKQSAGVKGKPKDYARTIAQQYYPEAELSRKKDVDRADAILIARFGLPKE